MKKLVQRFNGTKTELFIGQYHGRELFRINDIDSDTNGKKMLYSSFISGFLLFFLVSVCLTPVFSHSVDTSENETLVEGN